VRIVGAAVEAVRLALRRPLATAHGTIGVRETFVLRLHAEDGTRGEGEAGPAYWLGEGSLAATESGLRRVVARVGDWPDAHELRAWWMEERDLDAAAACALDAALVDLAARRAGVPACALLAAGDARRPAELVPVAALVGGSDTAALAAAVDGALAGGFTTLKLKVGDAGLADDRARVDALRERAGARIALRLDANRAWTADEARRALAALAPAGPAFVEEPLRDSDPRVLADLARTSGVALAVDESIATVDDLERLINGHAPLRDADARVHVVLKAGRVGGPTRLVALARWARAAGLTVVVTDGIEGAVGTGVAVHAAAAIGTDLAVGLGGAQLVDALAALRGPWVRPSGPGFAIAVAAGAEPKARHG
jgi:o-succinylbenzoate synthase